MPGQGVGRTSCFLFWSNSQLSGAGYSTFTALRELPNQVMEDCCLPQGKGTAIPQASEVISSPVRRNTSRFPPCSNLFPDPLLSSFLPPSSQFPPGNFPPGPAVEMAVGQGRRGQPAVCVAHGATAGHSCRERPGSSAGLPARVLLAGLHTSDHQNPQRGQGCCGVPSMPCTRDVPQPRQRVLGNSLQAAAGIHVSWTLATTWPSCL